VKRVVLLLVTLITALAWLGCAASSTAVPTPTVEEAITLSPQAAEETITVSPPSAPKATTTSPSIAEGAITLLPPPSLDGETSLEESLARRRSVRDFDDTPLTAAELGQLLWAAQGLTNERGLRTAPSAGALYPLELYLVTAEGVFHYEPHGHQLSAVRSDDRRAALYEAALSQEAVLRAPAVFVVTAVYARTEQKYGAERSPRYVHLEAGHAAQNLLLEAVALGLGAVPIGAFHDEQVQEALGLPPDHEPLYLIPAGHPRGEGRWRRPTLSAEV
jgi:SagB-type dehydrogenase family enzyme